MERQLETNRTKVAAAHGKALVVLACINKDDLAETGNHTRIAIYSRAFGFSEEKIRIAASYALMSSYATQLSTTEILQEALDTVGGDLSESEEPLPNMGLMALEFGKAA